MYLASDPACAWNRDEIGLGLKVIEISKYSRDVSESAGSAVQAERENQSEEESLALARKDQFWFVKNRLLYRQIT
jgi:hypothetical protein